VEPEEERVRRAQAGDDVAFEHLVRDVYPTVYRWALVQTQSADDADDVTQAALVRVHMNLAGFRHGARFSTWLYAIVRRTATDWRRSVRRRSEREERWSDELPRHQPPDTGRGDADRAVAALHVAVHGLPARQREVFDLADLQGVPCEEIAVLLDLRPATVRVHLLRARRAVRARLLEREPQLMEEWS
jgi:RNA polymerase sigma-70 factor, ECF subfamily